MSLKPLKLKKLQALWDRKLKKSGFEDAEDNTGKLKSYHSLEFFNSGLRHPDYQEGKAEYYRAAGHFLHSYKFADKEEEHLWQMHCEGQSLKHYRSKKYTCSNIIYRAIRRLAKEMKASWKT